MATANDLRRGMAISHNGDVCVVLDMQHRTPGNLRAFVQATLRSIRSGKSSDVRFSSTERIDVIPMMTRKMEFSYKDGEDFVFSDPETYETVTLSPELVGDAKNYLVENGLVTVTFVEDKAVSVEIPPSVVLTVADAPEGVPAIRRTTFKSRWCSRQASRCRRRCSSRPAKRSKWTPARASIWNARKRFPHPISSPLRRAFLLPGSGYSTTSGGR
jgi:elongation factor P